MHEPHSRMWEIREGRRFIRVRIIGVGVGLGFVLVLSGRNEGRRLDLVYLIKEGLNKGLMVRASLDLLLLLVNSDSTEWLVFITPSRKRESLSVCDASGKMIPMWFDVPFASHTRAIGAFSTVRIRLLRSEVVAGVSVFPQLFRVSSLRNSEVESPAG